MGGIRQRTSHNKAGPALPTTLETQPHLARSGQRTTVASSSPRLTPLPPAHLPRPAQRQPRTLPCWRQTSAPGGRGPPRATCRCRPRAWPSWLSRPVCGAEGHQNVSRAASTRGGGRESVDSREAHLCELLVVLENILDARDKVLEAKRLRHVVRAQVLVRSLSQARRVRHA